MIREIINFSAFIEEELSSNQSQLREYIKPTQNGLYIFLSSEGSFEMEFYKDGVAIKELLKECISRLNHSWTIEYDKKPYYQKCFDLPQKRIHSVSPFLVAVKRKYLDGGTDYQSKKVDLEYIKRYLTKATNETTDSSTRVIANSFQNILSNIYSNLISEIKKYNFKKDDYVIIVFNTGLDNFRNTYNSYLKLKIFNSADKGLTDADGHVISEKEAMKKDVVRGWSNFFSGYNEGKPFLRHQSALFQTNTITNKEARLLYSFKEYRRMGLLPNPLPIFVDKEEVKKHHEDGKKAPAEYAIVKIFNELKKPSYAAVIKKLFDDYPDTFLQKYYLLNFDNSGNIGDFDFVPLFRYRFDTTLVIENVTEAATFNNNAFVKDSDERLNNIFEFERIVVKTIFNNSLVKIKDGEYKTKYFDDIKSEYVIGKEPMWQLIMRYRKAFYDYIYKSATNALTTSMFDDMMYNSILTNIYQDEITSRCEYNNDIKRKINIWFSLYNLFNNDKTVKIMASNITDLSAKMASVSKGESYIETPEEFAFGAGQLASYLIDRSAASNKTYAMLETYLQKTTPGQLQDTLAQTIAIYKHEIIVCKGRFESLAAQVLTFDSNANIRPLLKFFLAGCFCPCVIYTPNNEEDNNNNH